LQSFKNKNKNKNKNIRKFNLLFLFPLTEFAEGPVLKSKCRGKTCASNSKVKQSKGKIV
jgi:hypothetical protein